MMRAHSFLTVIFMVIREKNDLSSKIYKPAKVVHYPVSCLSHHYIYLVAINKSNKTKETVATHV